MKKVLFLVSLLISFEHFATWDYGNIHIFGDSHSAYSFTNLYSAGIPPTPSLSNWPLTYEKSSFNYNETISAPFLIHWISFTMHEIGKSGLNTLDFRKYDVQNGDIALVHFGGMDFYHGHIERQYMRGRSLEDIVGTLAQNFIATVIANKKMYENLTIIVMGAMAPCIFPHNKNEFVQFVPNVSYESFIGGANKMLNAELARHCKSNDLLYINVNAFFQDAKGILRPELSDRVHSGYGGHHVKPSYNYVIKQELVKLIIENNASGFRTIQTILLNGTHLIQRKLLRLLAK